MIYRRITIGNLLNTIVYTHIIYTFTFKLLAKWGSRVLFTMTCHSITISGQIQSPDILLVNVKMYCRI